MTSLVKNLFLKINLLIIIINKINFIYILLLFI